jgi:hypothetical protein
MDARPQARSDGVIAEPLDDGLVIYDIATQQAHSLDDRAARIWLAADGSRTLPELSRTAEVDEAAALAALDQLAAGGLLSEGVSRRSMLRRSATIGAAALVAAPVIESVVVPDALAHTSSYKPPTPKPICLGNITCKDIGVLVNVLFGFWGSGRCYIKPGLTNHHSFQPSQACLFDVVVQGNSCTFSNSLVNLGRFPKYHYILSGTAGNGAPVSYTVGGDAGSHQAFLLGPLLNLSIYLQLDI